MVLQVKPDVRSFLLGFIRVSIAPVLRGARSFFTLGFALVMLRVVIAVVAFEQISAVRDIARSSIEEASKSSGGNRMLRLTLTDGHSEMTAVEYSHIPALPDDVVPGTKVFF